MSSRAQYSTQTEGSALVLRFRFRCQIIVSGCLLWVSEKAMSRGTVLHNGLSLAFACIGWALVESACVDYNRPPYNSTSTSVCHACVSDPCGMPCTFCTEGRISKSAYCTSDLSQCSTENQKRRQIDCPQQETTQSSSERQQKNEISTSVTAYFDCSRDRVVLGNEAAINMGIR